jgi:hypothetical protein
MPADDAIVRATGGCLCGSVRYAVRGPLREVVVCHCGRCRRTHGDAAGYSSCAAPDLELIEDAGLRWFAQEGRERGFCRTCGASLFWRADGGATVSLAAGTIDAPTGLRTVAHIFLDSRGDYESPPVEGECFGAGLPDGWAAPVARGPG